ncbi:glycine zipper domain-containing protein [Microvirga splendida]|uniref:Glycine zipper domain-containing protein n=1 Tax=Microvirga splendida TaxID=2795727 RepID=A0ABS0Y3D5_9HYPH|nr:glycine zipper domain-containing protein [Microvirga splendida]MBJ6126819.1 hypothetical protein [Microvirga splendida]
MYKIAFGLLACAAVAACSPTTTGTVAGATTGAIVGGPVGAVVGGGIGAVAGATTSQQVQARPGWCYVYDQKNRRLNNVYGDPQLQRC